ncbi:unnamed protein product, partial [Urochloa humidicola]
PLRPLDRRGDAQPGSQIACSRGPRRSSPARKSEIRFAGWSAGNTKGKSEREPTKVMAGVHQWRGYDVHGFDGPEALAYSMDNAGHRHAHNFEVCAKLMNGGLYATNNPPPDAEDHKEFEHLIVSDPVYGQMAMDGGVDHRGWIGYKPTVGLRTRELPVGSLKINHQISLPCREINGGSKFRRHVVLPPSLLQPGDVIYHFLEYKTLPNMEFRERASALAHRAAAAAAA